MNNKLVVKTLAQLKREVLEYRWGLVYIPALLSTLFVIFGSAIAYYFLYVRTEDISLDFTVSRMSMDFMYANCALVMFFYFFILANFLASCLYDDRKSKQILFWKSMPVSETMNVMVKIAVVAIVAPSILLLINTAIALAAIAITYLLTSGLENAQFAFAAPDQPNLFVVILQIYRDNLLGMLFLAPFIGYLLVVSAWVRRFPLAIAFGIPMLLAFVDFLLGRVGMTIGIFPLLQIYGDVWAGVKNTFILREVFEFKLHYLVPLLISLTVGGLLVALSIWLRNNRHEI
jgi:hypothetical protein